MFRSFVCAALLAISMTCPAIAQDPTALQVTAEGGEQMSLSLADLDALDQVSITTTTIWTEGEVTFTGPSLTSVLNAAGADGRDLTLTALNDYAIEMPAPESGATYPVIATRMDGAPMSVRTRAPSGSFFRMTATRHTRRKRSMRKAYGNWIRSKCWNDNLSEVLVGPEQMKGAT